MPDDHDAKLLVFLASQFALRDHQTCVKVELEYTPSAGYRAEPIQAWTPASHPDFFGLIPKDDTGEFDEKKAVDRRHIFTQRLVGEIMELANNFADSYDSGTHRFTVRTLQHLGGRATHRFALKPSYRGDANDDSAPLEATGSGVVTQLMRHLENKERGMREMMGTFLQTMRHNFDSLREENEALRKQVNDAHAWREKTVAAIEEARSKEHDRELELAIVMGERERKDFAVKKVVNLLPVAMSAAMRKLASSGTINGTKKAEASPLAQTLARLASSITDDQKAGIQASLAIEQIVALQEIIEGALDGGSLLLPTLVHDFTDTLRPPQVQALMGLFTHEQATLFVQAMQLAKASVATEESKTKTPELESQSQQAEA